MTLDQKLAQKDSLTIERLLKEKRILKEKIEKALKEFDEATGCIVSGEFRMETTYQRCGNESPEVYRDPKVTINPVQI